MDEMDISNSPIVFARKPLEENTVVDNVLKWGTGGINIDESRIGTTKRTPGYKNPGTMMVGSSEWNKLYNGMQREVDVNEGRFPANLILDTEAAKVLDEQSGISKSAKVKNDKGAYAGVSNTGFMRGVSNSTNQYDDRGGASRFFYQPKDDEDYENTDKKENNMRLLLGDCLDKLKELEDNSVDSIVTDPPYGLSFMGKQWDYDVPSVDIWKECLRVLKPGGHLLAFAGSRTYHRMAVRIEDAGFEIRDMISWLYGSGFPKSMDISKQIDKKPNADLKEFSKALKERRIELGLSLSEADKLITGGTTMYSFLEGRKDNDVYPPNKEYWEKIKEHFGMDEWSSIIENNLKIVGEEEGSFGYQKDGERWGEKRTLTETTSDLAKQWSGWGTALKPAHEPVVMARKPLEENTVVDNVLKHGTGGINIDESRISHNEPIRVKKAQEGGNKVYGQSGRYEDTTELKPEGRFPANLILDEEAGKLLDEQSGISKSIGGRIEKKIGWGEFGGNGSKEIIDGQPGFGDSGGASRFFYCPKVSKSERNEGLDGFEKKVTRRDDGQPYGMNTNKFRPDGSERKPVEAKQNHHPTVKPVDLMLYLIRLVTPKGGVTLDPFMGSGSSGKAAVRGGFDFIGIEREDEYFEIAKSRIEYEKKKPIIVETPTGKKVEVKKEVEEKVNQFFG